jgi:predicted acetyltransferase
MHIEVRQALRSERLVVRHMMELYQYDFSALDGGDLDEHGQYGYYDLDCFWITQNFSAHVIQVDGKWAGFALVNDEVALTENALSIVEFFVLRKYRRHGVGRYAARCILNATPSAWEIKVIQENPSALKFWQSAIEQDWPGCGAAVMLDDDRWHGPVFSVDNRPA